MHPTLLLKRTRLVVLVAVTIIMLPHFGQSAPELNTNAEVSEAKTAVNVFDSLKTLRGEVDGVEATYAAYLKATEDAQRDKLWKAYTETNDSLIPKVVGGVRQFPDSPEAFGLLEWAVANGRISTPTLRPYRVQAVEILRDHYTAHTNISTICRELGISGASDPAAVDFLTAASTNNPDRGARGAATFALGWLAKRKAEDMAFWKSAASSIYTNAAAQKAREALQNEPKDSQGVLQEAEQLFRTVKTTYADVPNFKPGPGLRQPEPTMGEQASRELYECEHLEVGKLAPEIQGEDIDGHRLRLSDYQGKVVLISFWASWCGPCMQMVPHEREIAQRLGGKPFVVIGVNGDSTRADAKRAIAEQKMTWKSFWNNGSEGGIAGTWNVHAWPTVYVLDAKGTIRLKFEGYGGKKTDALLDAEADRLLEEIKAVVN